MLSDLEMVSFSKGYAREVEGIVAITGAIDLVTDEEICYVIRNGRAEMGRVTGTGCMLSGILCAYLITNPKDKLEAATAGMMPSWRLRSPKASTASASVIPT